MAQVQPVVQAPRIELLQSHTRRALLGGIVHEQALAQAGAKAVHHVDLPLRVFFPQLGGGNFRRLIGGAQAGGEGDDQGILTGFQHFLHGIAPGFRIHGGSGGHFPGPQPGVKVLQVGFLVMIGGLPTEGDAQGHFLHVNFGVHGIGVIAAGIGNDLVSHFGISLKKIYFIKHWTERSIRHIMEGPCLSYRIFGFLSRSFLKKRGLFFIWEAFL